MMAVIRVIVELLKELVALFTLRLSTEPAPEPPKPQTPKEKADDDIQNVQKAAVGGDAAALMREFERLRLAALGAGTATADTATGAAGEGDSSPGRP